MNASELESRDLLSDADLLADFQIHRDDDSFEVLVHRYSHLVFGVCRRVISNRHDAEDAFQATFLVLAENAKRIRNTNALSSWLFGVAYRVSIRVSRKRAKQPAPHDDVEIGVCDDAFEHLSNKFMRQKMDEALRQLPEKLRTPIILRYLMGQSNAEVAESLNLSIAAVEGRLKRAKSRLRMSLTRYGVTLGAALVALTCNQRECSAELAESLIDLIATAASGNPETGTAASSDAIQLALEEGLSMSLLQSSKLTATLAGCTVLLSAAVVLPWAAALAGPQDAENSSVDVVQKDNDESSPESQLPVAVRGVSPNATANSTPQSASKSPARHDNRLFSPTEQAVLAALGTSISVDFQEKTVQDVIDYLKEVCGIQIVVDHQALDDLGLTSDDPVTNLSLQDVKLENVLALTLMDLDLTYVVMHEVLVITSEERTEEVAETRVYNVNRDWSVEPEQLVEIIRTQIQPTSWDEVGGTGSISAIKTGLVITQTVHVHRKIHNLLDQLDENAERASN